MITIRDVGAMSQPAIEDVTWLQEMTWHMRCCLAQIDFKGILEKIRAFQAAISSAFAVRS